MSSAKPLPQAYLVGGGIASLAAAAYLIHEGPYSGSDIRIFEESGDIGGSLDAHCSPAGPYRLRGGRMLNYSYLCTYDLLSFIPSYGNEDVSVYEEIQAFNKAHPSKAKARLVENGLAVDVSSMGFSARDRVALIEMSLRSEDSLHAKRIDQCFDPAFFETNFWYMWATTFAFAPWHSAVEFKRYLHRFIQEFPRISTLAGVDRTPYNQFDSIVRPLVRWLHRQGVTIQTGAKVSSLQFAPQTSDIVVRSLNVESAGNRELVPVRDIDFVFVTLGSMTAGSEWGSMSAPARMNTKAAAGSWSLWESMVRDRPVLGRPDVFDGRIDQSAWLSFTITFTSAAVFERLQAFTGTALCTFKDSHWLLSLVLSHQPHFMDQPDGVFVAWGYALFADRPGNYVNKAMRDCSGEEILTELSGHLKLGIALDDLIKSCTCLPCMMPFITSQFLTREKGDRPDVIPKGSKNLALLGQFCEIPQDTVFTVEYSIRSAQIAVFGLLGLDRRPTPMYDGTRDPNILGNAIATMFS